MLRKGIILVSVPICLLAISACVAQSVFRLTIGHLLMLPYVIAYRAASTIIGKNRAQTVIGRLLTKSAESLSVLFFPRIEDGKYFPLFRDGMERLFTSLKPLYNFDVVEKNNTTIKFTVKNCPFAHALQSMGAPELGKFLCAGDFMVANHFKDTWKFKRTHSHGTDGQCCDHTYMAVESS